MQTKKALIETLAERTQQPLKLSRAFVDALEGVRHETLEVGETIHIAAKEHRKRGSASVTSPTYP